MQNLILRRSHYTQLDPMTWCATAQVRLQLQSSLWGNLPWPLAPSIAFIDSITLYNFYWQLQSNPIPLTVPEHARYKRQQQRSGVRLLLQQLLAELSIVDTLDDSQFPYRLMNSRHYVCFSHSANKVAVVISTQRAVGIDIETHNITRHVTQRFYHSTETTTLNELSLQQRDITAKWLWQIKESFIKIYQYKLAQGLGMNYSPLIADLIISLEPANSPLVFPSRNECNYQIALLPQQQTIIIF
ncbi:4'-phosphopantetheinyl transferase superfamily protein [Psychrobacter sp. CAL346-MNA-CIBAN-0220]|uniref:4'-phosphopantetheinyl transferase family protein n=1 Tax=Psychrobacter sp. CAL346-MNA-CIBAN-0220 TaxID=3140457 RepID=UPI00331EB2B1